MKNSNDFSMLLTSFLSKHLPGQRNVCTNTVMSYRDNFKLFIHYCKDEQVILPLCLSGNARLLVPMPADYLHTNEEDGWQGDELSLPRGDSPPADAT